MRRFARPRQTNWQLRAEELARELLSERQQHGDRVAQLERSLALERETRAMRDAQVMTLERAVEGVRAQLLSTRRELARVMRAHGLGDQVRDAG